MTLTMTLNNLSNQQVAIDLKLDEDRAVRENVAVGASLDLSALEAAPTLDELEGPAGADLRTLMDAGAIEILLSGSQLPLKSASVTLVDLLAAAADDVTLVASMPTAARLMSVKLDVTTAVGASTVDLRDTIGGAGASFLTATMSGAAVAVVADDSIAAVARGDLLTVRRSDDGIEGTLVVLYQQTSL